MPQNMSTRKSRPVVTISRVPSACSLIGQTVYARGSDKPIAEFLGVPYAAPPVGQKRFRPPQTLELWSGIRDADKHGPACPQDSERAERTYGRLPNSPSSYDEDCLYLNIWSPTCTPGANIPVMVWVHGGAFVQGFSNIYEGSPLAAYGDVIAISINYRLGVFGYLQTGDGPDDYHGNQGLLDQLEALRWIKKYIKYFGGDPNNITLFGESAGGISISFHLASPQAAGLFHRAIIQSGPGIVSNSAWPSAGGQKYWWKRIHAMGFEGRDSKSLVTFLGNQSTETLLKSFDDWFVPTVVDGKYLTQDTLITFKNGQFHPKECMIGFNSTEGVGFVPTKIDDRKAAEEAIGGFITKNFFRGFPKAFTEELFKLAKAEYLDNTCGNYVSDVSDFYGDCNFASASLLQAQYHCDVVPTYVYLFDHRPMFSQHPPWVRADHGNEIPFVYGFPFMTSIPDVWSDEEKQLSKTVMKYWTNFAKTGNPNGVCDDNTIWHQHTRGSPRYLHIRTQTADSCNTEDVWTTRMKLWNQTVPQLLAQSSPVKSKY